MDIEKFTIGIAGGDVRRLKPKTEEKSESRHLVSYKEQHGHGEI
jgi:hypothetical protein